MCLFGAAALLRGAHAVSPPQYIFGDFFLHWLPSLVVLALARYDALRYDTDHVIAQIWSGYALLLTWSYFNNPWDVYGCGLPDNMVIVVPFILAVVMTVVVLFILRLVGITSTRATSSLLGHLGYSRVDTKGPRR